MMETACPTPVHRELVGAFENIINAGEFGFFPIIRVLDSRTTVTMEQALDVLTGEEDAIFWTNYIVLISDGLDSKNAIPKTALEQANYDSVRCARNQLMTRFAPQFKAYLEMDVTNRLKQLKDVDLVRHQLKCDSGSV